MIHGQGAGEGRRRGCRLALNVRPLKTRFRRAYVISGLCYEYPDVFLLCSAFCRPGLDLIFCSFASARGSMKGRGILVPLYMLCYLLECSSPSCPLIHPSVVIKTTLILKIAKVTLSQAPC